MTPEGMHGEEHLAFALSDGRVGMLSVRGRRIQDLRPCAPHHLELEEGGGIGRGARSAWWTVRTRVVAADVECIHDDHAMRLEAQARVKFAVMDSIRQVASRITLLVQM